MVYSADRPINNSEQDLLGRSSFSKQLAKGILEYHGSDGLVIGLFGKWGTGKTSILNMAIDELERMGSNRDNKPLVTRFSPWNYSDKNDLIGIFFRNLMKTINLKGNDEFKNKVGEALRDYSGVLDLLELIPGTGSTFATIAKNTAQAQGKKLMKGDDLDETRRKLADALRAVGKKIIVTIDDIDRLTNSQIRDIFQLVKQVGDFPNIIYILAMDRDVVRGALAEVHNFDGNEYLEKI